MAFLRPWIPFRQMGEFRRNIDDMLDRLRSEFSYPLRSRSTAQKPPLESFVEEGKLIICAELPGIDPKEISVNVVGDMLTILASRQEEHEAKKRDFLHREFSYGIIERSVPLPKGVKAEDIKATFLNGLLQLTIPIPDESAPTKIHVEHDQPKRASRKTV